MTSDVRDCKPFIKMKISIECTITSCISTALAQARLAKASGFTRPTVITCLGSQLEFYCNQVSRVYQVQKDLKLHNKCYSIRRWQSKVKEPAVTNEKAPILLCKSIIQ